MAKKKKTKVEKISEHHKRIVELGSYGEELYTHIVMAKPVRVADLKQMPSSQLVSLLPAQSLGDGSHDEPGSSFNSDAELCLMEAVAFISGEEHSDHPRCACPVLTSIGINFNDSHGGNDVERNELIDAIPSLVGSRTESARVRWRRAKRFTQILLENAATQIADELSEDPSILLAERIDKNAQFKTRDDVKRLMEDLDLFPGIDAAIEAKMALDKLYKNWKPDALSKPAYERIIQTDITDLFESGAAQAKLLQELGDIRS